MIKIVRGKTKIVRQNRRNIKIPPLETMFEDDGDPLENVSYNKNDLEASADSEMSEILRQIIERRKALRDRFRVAGDTDYWVALCFQTSEQRDEFLEKSGWGARGTRYLNGLEISGRINVDIKPIELSPIPQRGRPEKYTRKEVI